MIPGSPSEMTQLLRGRALPWSFLRDFCEAANERGQGSEGTGAGR